MKEHNPEDGFELENLIKHSDNFADSEGQNQVKKVNVEAQTIGLSSKIIVSLFTDPDLWKYEVVKYGGRTYCWTRLWFGLNVALKIMRSILKKILSIDDKIRAGKDSYIEDCEVVQKLLKVPWPRLGRTTSLNGGR